MPTPGYLSNAELAASISAVVSRWNTRENQMIALISQATGTVNVTDGNGNVHVIKSFPQLQLDVTAMADEASGIAAQAQISADSALASANAAQAVADGLAGYESAASDFADAAAASATAAAGSATAASGSASSASTSAATATTKAGDASASATAAAGSATAASGSASAASGSASAASTSATTATTKATLAGNYANAADGVEVEPGKYSAKHWANVASTYGGGGGSGTVTNVSGTAPINVTNGTTTPAITISAATTSAAGSMSAADKTKLDAISGTNTGDQTITLTGAVTGSGSGSFATTLANSTVTLAKMADMATGSLFYRKTAGTGAPEVQTLATLKTDLGLTGTNSGDQTITLTGAVTGSGTGSFATTLANSIVTLAKMADMATASVFYRKTAGTGAPEVQTLATLKTDLGLTGTNTGDQDLSALAPKASPALTGTPTSTTATPGDSSTRIATTAFVRTPTAASAASGSTLTPTAADDYLRRTAQAASLSIANPTGTFTDGMGFIIVLKDNGTARAISHGTNYMPSDSDALPTTTVVGKTMMMGYIYDSTLAKFLFQGVRYYT